MAKIPRIKANEEIETYTAEQEPEHPDKTTRKKIKLDTLVNNPDIIEVVAAVDGYIVGGPVRDALLGYPIHDIDIATPYRDEELIKRLDRLGRKYYVKDQELQVYAVKLGDLEIDITPYRIEEYRGSMRRPEHVSYAETIEQDLARRDFTVNAMAYNPITMELVDPYGGLQDLQDKILRYVGEPGMRISEDPLRMIRFARFSAKYGFNMDDRGVRETVRHAHLLDTVSRERITEEFRKSLPHWDRFIDNLDKLHLLERIIDRGKLKQLKDTRHDFRGRHYGETIYQHTLDVLKNLEKLGAEDPPLYFAALYHDFGKPETIQVKNGKTAFHGHEKVSADIWRRDWRSRWRGLSRRDYLHAHWIIKNHMLMNHIIENPKNLVKHIVRWRLEKIPRRWIENLITHSIADGKDIYIPEIKTRDGITLTPYDILDEIYKIELPRGDKYLHHPPEKRGEAIYNASLQKTFKELKKRGII